MLLGLLIGIVFLLNEYMTEVSQILKQIMPILVTCDLMNARRVVTITHQGLVCQHHIIHYKIMVEKNSMVGS